MSAEKETLVQSRKSQSRIGKGRGESSQKPRRISHFLYGKHKRTTVAHVFKLTLSALRNTSKIPSPERKGRLPSENCFSGQQQLALGPFGRYPRGMALFFVLVSLLSRKKGAPSNQTGPIQEESA